MGNLSSPLHQCWLEQGFGRQEHLPFPKISDSGCVDFYIFVFLPPVWTKMHESDIGNEFVISNPFIATICLVNPQLEGRMGSRDN